LDHPGRVLINFDSRGEADVSIPDKFMGHIQNNDKILPDSVFRVDDWCFPYIERPAMYFVTVTRTNSNITLLLTFLSALAKVLDEYLDPLSPVVIVDHFSQFTNFTTKSWSTAIPRRSIGGTSRTHPPRQTARSNCTTGVRPSGCDPCCFLAHGRYRRFIKSGIRGCRRKVDMLVAQNAAAIHTEVVGGSV
jgi:hypothetical protein